MTQFVLYLIGRSCAGFILVYAFIELVMPGGLLSTWGAGCLFVGAGILYYGIARWYRDHKGEMRLS